MHFLYQNQHLKWNIYICSFKGSKGVQQISLEIRTFRSLDAGSSCDSRLQIRVLSRTTSHSWHEINYLSFHGKTKTRTYSSRINLTRKKPCKHEINKRLCLDSKTRYDTTAEFARNNFARIYNKNDTYHEIEMSMMTTTLFEALDSRE